MDVYWSDVSCNRDCPSRELLSRVLSYREDDFD